MEGWIIQLQGEWIFTTFLVRPPLATAMSEIRGVLFTTLPLTTHGNLYYGGTANIVTFNGSGTISNGAFVIDSVEFVGTALVNAVTGGHTFNYFLMQADGTINGSNTFNNLLELTEGHTYIFNDATTQTFYGDLVAVGTCSNPINIQSSTATPAIFHKDGSAITVTRVNLANMSATGTATFTANESINLGNNTGWIINAPAAQNLYWVGDDRRLG